MGAIFEVLSGKRYRENQAEKIAFTRAIERYQASNLATHPMLEKFAVALAISVSSAIRILIFDNKEPEFKALAKSLDETIISDLAAFIAWRYTFLFVDDDKADSRRKDQTISENSLAWWRDISLTSETMYPRSAAAEGVVLGVRSLEKTIESGKCEPSALPLGLSWAVLKLMHLDEEVRGVLRFMSAPENIKREMRVNASSISPIPPSKSLSLSLSIDRTFRPTRDLLAQNLADLAKVSAPVLKQSRVER